MIKEFKSGDGCRFMCTCLPGSTSVFDMLQKVKLSNSLTEIPNSCFDSNISLREIVIPDSVSTIGPYAFCSSGLENIHLGKCIKIMPILH